MKRLSTIILLMLVAERAAATMLTLSGTFAASGGTPFDGSEVSSIDGIAGTWSSSFDDSLVIGSGPELFTISPSSLSLEPSPLGTTVFDTTNSMVDLFYVDGVLTVVGVGGGQPGLLASGLGIDDFRALYFVFDGTVVSVAWKVSTQESGFFVDLGDPTGDLSGSLSIVPVPATGWLLLSGIAGLWTILFHRRRPRSPDTTVWICPEKRLLDCCSSR